MRYRTHFILTYLCKFALYTLLYLHFIMDIRYKIKGGIPLRGDITIDGSKNAALPIIAGTVLCNGITTLHNVPQLSDVRILLDILEFLGAKTEQRGNTVTIDNSKLQSKQIPAEYVNKLRGSIVLLGPLLARFGVVEMAYPGGCVLGKRSVEAHIEAFKQLGASDMSNSENIHLQGTLKAGYVLLPEFSVTATENAILAAALTAGVSTIDIAAAEPHVQDVCAFLQSMGVQIEGVGTHTVKVTGIKSVQCAEHTVITDYLETGMWVIAALATQGKLRLHGVRIEDLRLFLNVLKRAGAVWSYEETTKTLFVDGEISSINAMKVQTNIFPGFPTDLQAPMGVLMTQAKGVSRVFEVLFEGRMAYLYELEKMGAHVEILNSHQALVIGPTALRGKLVASNDIRAGAAMVIAALCAEGESTITDIKYLERGYHKLDEKLQSLGANVERIVIE
jgi:UDP-N-acetylglucosamine 1-carboxyvinyltransferase